LKFRKYFVEFVVWERIPSSFIAMLSMQSLGPPDLMSTSYVI